MSWDRDTEQTLAVALGQTNNLDFHFQTISKKRCHLWSHAQKAVINALSWSGLPIWTNGGLWFLLMVAECACILYICRRSNEFRTCPDNVIKIHYYIFSNVANRQINACENITSIIGSTLPITIQSLQTGNTNSELGISIFGEILLNLTEKCTK